MINVEELQTRVDFLRSLHEEVYEVTDYNYELETTTKWNETHCLECRVPFPCLTIMTLNGKFEIIEDKVIYNQWRKNA